MKVYLATVEDSELLPIFEASAVRSPCHTVVEDPGAADLVLLVGSFGLDPEALLGHPAYKAYPDRCAVFTEDDNYLPLAPGVYCSAHRDRHTRIGRVFSYSYVSRNGRYKNPYVSEVASGAPKNVAQEKKYLFTFQGGSTSLLRKRLFNQRFERSDILIENTSTYYHWDESQVDRRERQIAYAENVATSHFVLCPRGAGAGTIRFFEVMEAGIAPVLLSDDYMLPPGPAWDAFLIRVRERDISKLPAILEEQLQTAAERGQLARAAFLAHFSAAVEFDRVIELAARSLLHGPPSEHSFRRRRGALVFRAEVGRKSRAIVRATVLRTLSALHLKNPYQMNR